MGRDLQGFLLKRRSLKMKTLPFFLLNVSVTRADQDVCVTEWSECTETCDGGFQTCSNAAGGKLYQDCNLQDCPVTNLPHIPNECINGYFSACSVSCGGGTQSCTSTSANTGDGTFTRECNTHSCAGIRRWFIGQDTAELKIIGTEDPKFPLSSLDGGLQTMWRSGPVTSSSPQGLEVVFPTEVEFTEIILTPRQYHGRQIDQILGNSCSRYGECTERVRNLELLIDDKLISKTLANLRDYRWPLLHLLGWDDGHFLGICNECETIKSGTSVKFQWRHPEHSPAEILSISILYRIPGQIVDEDDDSDVTYTQLWEDCSVTCGSGTQWTRNICTGVWGEPGCPNSRERTYRECHMPACDIVWSTYNSGGKNFLEAEINDLGSTKPGFPLSNLRRGLAYMMRPEDFWQSGPVTESSPQGLELVFPQPVEIAHIALYVPWGLSSDHLFSCRHGTSNCDYRYTNLEFWVDDKLVSKTSKSFQLSHTHSDMFIKDVLIGWNTRNKLQICNDCESTQTGSRFRFIWTGGEYGKTWQHDGQLKEFWGNDPYPAALGRIEFSYRDPENKWDIVDDSKVEDCEDYNPCSVTCGGGEQECRNTCDGGKSHFGGPGCPGNRSVNRRSGCFSHDCRKVWNDWWSGDEIGEIRNLGGTKSGSISNIDRNFNTFWTSNLPSLSRKQLNICFTGEKHFKA